MSFGFYPMLLWFKTYGEDNWRIIACIFLLCFRRISKQICFMCWGFASWSYVVKVRKLKLFFFEISACWFRLFKICPPVRLMSDMWELHEYSCLSAFIGSFYSLISSLSFHWERIPSNNQSAQIKFLLFLLENIRTSWVILVFFFSSGAVVIVYGWWILALVVRSEKLLGFFSFRM